MDVVVKASAIVSTFSRNEVNNMPLSVISRADPNALKAECLQGETDGDAVPGGNGRLALMARSVG